MNSVGILTHLRTRELTSAQACACINNNCRAINTLELIQILGFAEMWRKLHLIVTSHVLFVISFIRKKETCRVQYTTKNRSTTSQSYRRSRREFWNCQLRCNIKTLKSFWYWIFGWPSSQESLTGWIFLVICVDYTVQLEDYLGLWGRPEQLADSGACTPRARWRP